MPNLLLLWRKLFTQKYSATGKECRKFHKIKHFAKMCISTVFTRLGVAALFKFLIFRMRRLFEGRAAIFPFVNGLCHPNVVGLHKCTLRTLTSSSHINKKPLKIFHLFSFLDFKFNDGLSGLPNPNRNSNLTVPVAGFLRLVDTLT